ncbi:ankyrin repeat protein [Aspergillus tubingensis]|uniref:ankyrin repeat protein n=1 Tax=Aspergillus tubingensis TaxID=5068 RepID=UPI001578CF40|nr:ankyrin repeat protein [Aspergillus tubingensis]GFN17065.1 ankyrin repeat protein [Aspergillus tubingensis]
MASLSNLPLELLRWVAEYLTTQRDISHLMQTNTRLYHAMHPILCEYNVQHDESSALPWAAQKGETRLVTKLLTAGANISAYSPSPRYVERKVHNSRDIDPWAKNNSLLYAAQGGHTAILKTLLGETRSGQTASPAQLRSVLHWALRQHDEQLVELMFAHKAPLDPATESSGAPSALGVAVAASYNAILPRLLALGARPGPHECPCPTERAIFTKQPEVIRLLLDHGLGLYGDNAVCHLAHEDDRDTLRLLLAYGMDLVNYGSAALFTAIRDGHYEMTELLIDNGAIKDVCCELYPPSGLFLGTAYSAVAMAILYERLDILRLLLDKGFLPGPRDLELATERSFTEAVSLLTPFAERDLHDGNVINMWHAFGWDPNNPRPRDGSMWDIKSRSQGIIDTSGTREPEPESLWATAVSNDDYNDSDGDYDSELEREYWRNSEYGRINVSY